MARARDYRRTLLPGCEVPAEVDAVREEIADVLESGLAVTVFAHEATLTTQQAADVLGVSRPTLVRILEGGGIPYEQPGHHRRVRLDDVLAFRDARHHPAHEEGDQP